MPIEHSNIDIEVDIFDQCDSHYQRALRIISIAMRIIIHLRMNNKNKLRDESNF